MSDPQCFKTKVMSLVVLFCFLVTVGCQPILQSQTSPSQSPSTEPLPPPESTCGVGGPVVPPPSIPNILAKSWPKVSHALLAKFQDAKSNEISDSQGKGTQRTKIQSVQSDSWDLVTQIDEICFDQRYTLQNAPGWPKELLNKIADQHGAPLRRRFLRWSAPVDVDTEKLVAWAQREPCLIRLSENRIFTLDLVPDDVYYEDQKHLSYLHAETSWDQFYDATRGIREDVVVAVIDSGVEISHADLAQQLWVNSGEIPGNNIDDDGNGYVDDVNGYNFVSQIGDPSPENWPAEDGGGEGHGTHVAGLVAAQGNNTLGVAGVAWQYAKIMGLNVFGPSAGGSIDAIVNAIDYAVAQGADVINMSLGASGVLPELEEAMKRAVSQGVTIVVAAGNSSEELTDENFVSPASYGASIAGVINVGSIDVFTREVSWFSNYSSYYVELLAPGSHQIDRGLLSTYLNNTYAYLQGTSMASPVVAGSAALVIGQLKALGHAVTPSLVEQILLDSSLQDLKLATKVKNAKRLDLENIGEAFTRGCY